MRSKARKLTFAYPFGLGVLLIYSIHAVAAAVIAIVMPLDAGRGASVSRWEACYTARNTGKRIRSTE